MSAKTIPNNTPRKIIERIRTHNFLIDIDSASDMVKEGALNLQTQLNNALKLLSEDLYSKKSHFVLELVQNADDNQYAPEVTPHLMLQVDPSCLVTVNNEVGFTEENVKAICSVGASSKLKKKAGYIGEKGIGFKSVFTVSDAPEIHSNGFHFKFDRTVEGNLLGYVVPHWCDVPANAPSDCTTIILPAKQTYEFSADTLVDIDARLLLFLNKLRKLTLVANGQRVTYRREDKHHLSILSVTSNCEDRDTQSEERHYVRAELALDINERYADEKRPGIERSTVVLAFPVDARNAAKPDPLSHVFSFLPIRQMGFKFCIQADFILNSSREEVLTDRPWNQSLRDGIAAAFLDALEIFKKSSPLALSYLRYVPSEGEIVDPFFRSVRTSIIGSLAEAKSLLSASGEWDHPSQLRIAEKSFRTLFPPEVAKELFGFNYVDARMQGGNELFRSLGAEEVGAPEVLSIFTDHGEWLRNQPLEWRAAFYAYVANNQQSLMVAGLLECPCLPVSDGTCVVPTNSNVFFPLGRGKKYGFESELLIVDNQLYEDAKKHSERVIELFAAMKVRSDDPYDLINAHILPRHKGEAWKTSDSKALVGHLRYIKDKMKDYLDAALAHGESEAQVCQRLRDGVWIGTKRDVDGTWWFAKVTSLYLSKEYMPQFCIESFLVEAIDKEKLVSGDYLAKRTQDPDVEANSWHQFFEKLGVRLAPAVEADGLDWKCSDELRLLLESSNSSVRRATLECMSVHWSKYADRLTYTYRVGRSDHRKDTKLALSLRSTQAPTKKKATVPLAQSYYPTSELKTLFGDALPYVDAVLAAPMLDACRVTYRLDAKALVKRLIQMKSDGTGTTKQVQGIYRVLDERLWNVDSAYIKQVFDSESLIQIKRARKGWYNPNEVAWRSSGPFLDSLYPPLHALYRDFSKFFCDKLKIPKDLPTAKWVEALRKLGDVNDLEDRKTEALNIYRRANRDLGPRFGREAQLPNWIEVFQTEAVYVNQHGELVANDEALFANDIPEIATLFEDQGDISFVAIPPSDIPRFSRLLEAAGVALLSECISHHVINSEAGFIDLDLTTRVSRSVVFFARVLFWKRHDDFEKALKEGRFAKLKELEVAAVPHIGLMITLADCSRETTADMTLIGDSVLYRTGARSVIDMLATELSKYLGTSIDLADTFARILMESEVGRIEDFLKVRSIGELPSDLLGLDTFTEAGGDEGVDEVSGLVDEEDPEDDSADKEEGGDAISTRIVGKERTSASHESEPNVATGKIGGLLEDRMIKAPSPTDGRSTRGSVGPALMAPDPASSTISAEATISRSKDDLSSAAPTHSPIFRSGVASRTKRGRRQQNKTKTGRLLSYAAGPNDASRRSADDDPIRARAREAIGRAAVDYFMTSQMGRWNSLTEMPHNNPGFDVLAITKNDQEEFIEIKGQSGAWTEEGVALTPTELMTAQQKGEHYWLCIVEYAQDEKRRQLHMLRNPYGLTQQFRFDVGWKSVAESVASVPLTPEKEMYIDMPGVGRGRILSVRDKGRFFNLHVILEDGRQVNKPFNPAKMTLSREPTWQG